MLIKNCLWCSSPNLKKVSKRSDGNTIIQCQKCSLLMVGELPKNIKILYKADYFQKDKESKIGYSNYFKNPIANQIGKYAFVKLFLPKNFVKYLDIGCADGSLIEVFKTNNYNSAGLEISADAVRIATNKGLDVSVSDLKEMPFANESYDFITAFDLLEHLDSPKQTLQEVKRVLKEGGIFFYSTLSISMISESEYWFNNSLEHLIYYDGETLQKLIEEIFDKGNAYNICIRNNGILENFGIAKNGPIFKEEKELLDLIENKGSFKENSEKSYYLSMLYNQLSFFEESKQTVQVLKKVLKSADVLFLEFLNFYFRGQYYKAKEAIDLSQISMPIENVVFWQAYADTLAKIAVIENRNNENILQEQKSILQEQKSILQEQKSILQEQKGIIEKKNMKIARLNEGIDLLYASFAVRNALRFQNLYKKTKGAIFIYLKIIWAYVPSFAKKIIKKILWIDIVYQRTVKNEVWQEAPLLTVVVFYNENPELLKATLNSLKGQTFQNFEIIILKTKKQTLDNLKMNAIIWENQTGDEVVVEILHKAKGKYSLIISSGSYIDPCYLEKSVVVLETDPNTSAVTGLFEDLENNGKSKQMSPEALVFRSNQWQETVCFAEYSCYSWGRLAQRQNIKTIPEKLIFINNSQLIQNALNPALKSFSWLSFYKKFIKLKTLNKSMFVNLDRQELYLQKALGKRNVLIIIPWMTFGGAETLIYNYCSQIKNDFNIFFVTGLQSKHEWEYKFREITPNIYHLANLFNDRSLYLEFFANYIKTRNIDVLHVIHNNFVYEFLPELRRRFPSLKIIVTLFNDFVDHFEMALDYDDYINVFTSDNSKVINHLRKELPDSKSMFYVFPNATDCYNAFNPKLFDREKQRDELDIGEDELAVFFIGRLSAEKKPDTFLDVTASILKKEKNIKFFMIGDGPMKDELLKKMNTINNRQLVYLGYQEQIPKYLCAADVFVLPSVVEGFPLSIVEAMSMKAGIIASDVGAISEVIKDGEEGFVVTPASVDEISAMVLELANNRKLLEKITNNARKAVEKKYSTVILGNNYKKLYEEK